ncbi:Phage tail-collar fibre protein [Onishia taeanensis]|uniref:Phage tail-collar fibre protein n=1 Tax=Onishia taeanensis TaxID=284577 RepID=A0A1G7VLT1_9GAMM|nr:phage tail protein [Halomonas taeanensis]SDG60772.1 Phage tail-collar fibre protein [Halomonas taeanensis]
MPQFYTLLTDTGQAKLANAVALGGTIEITELAVGDGGGSLPTPDSSATALINELRRAPINTSQTDPDNPSWIVVEQVLPPDVGGWTIREIGIIDADGDLIGIGNYPETYKPVLAEGSSRTQTVRFVLEVSDTAAVTLKVDPSVVLATRQFVEAERAAHEASRAHPLATEAQRGMAIKASQTEVNAGDDDGKFVTSMKLKNWATQWVKAATETVAGMLKIATQAQTDAGTDDTTAVTPKKLRWGVSYSISADGYIAFPSWLGGFILQWLGINSRPDGLNFTWPIPFPNDVFVSGALDYGTGIDVVNTTNVTNSGGTFQTPAGGGGTVCSIIAIGK